MKDAKTVLVLLSLVAVITFGQIACGDYEGAEEYPDPTCPECRSGDVIRMVYGEPSEEMYEAAERGEIGLGGCEISDDNPSYYCKECGYCW
ncbi:MAG: hypothetical protein GY771_03385 [bacterium]|nr:hypothetical protein [bacterium]